MPDDLQAMADSDRRESNVIKLDPTILINERVDVVVVFNKDSSRSLCMPRKMRHIGREITFVELGLRHPTAAGARMIHVFDMSDGSNDYRLEFDAEALTWRLLAILEGSNNVRAQH